MFVTGRLQADATSVHLDERVIELTQVGALELYASESCRQLLTTAARRAADPLPACPAIPPWPSLLPQLACCLEGRKPLALREATQIVCYAPGEAS